MDSSLFHSLVIHQVKLFSVRLFLLIVFESTELSILVFKYSILSSVEAVFFNLLICLGLSSNSKIFYHC